MQPPVPENRPAGDIPGPESNYLPPLPHVPPGVTLPGTVDQPRRPGRIRQQDETTEARPETVAEARARRRAQRQRSEEQVRLAREAAQTAAKKSRRRKQMIGAGVGVGVVGTIALLYAAVPDNNGGSANAVNTQTATCVVGDGDEQRVVADSYCSSGSFNPITGFILLNGMSYRYNYGGAVSNGRVLGGTYDRPPNTAFRTPSGAPIDSSKATSFSGGKTNAGTKPAPPQVSGNSGKSIDRGGLGTSNSGGSKSSGS